MITIKNLSYNYQSFEKSSGFLGSLKDFISRKYKKIAAIDGVSLHIKEGEIVGLLGANGAGKTTLIKLMTGILSPSSGNITCFNKVPYLKDKEYLKNIGVVLGQKSQLIWDLPAQETLNMLQVIYEIDYVKYKERLKTLTELLSVTHKLRTPVRKLSLGERIKFEIICSLIHSPRILFLDEPTIGLDITSQKAIRSFLKEINEQEKVTIILTSHYMQDIEETCKRVCILSKGKIKDDLEISQLTKKYTKSDNLVIKFKEEIPQSLLDYKVNNLSVKIPLELYTSFLSELNLVNIDSFYKEEQKFEDAILEIFKEGK